MCSRVSELNSTFSHQEFTQWIHNIIKDLEAIIHEYLHFTECKHYSYGQNHIRQIIASFHCDALWYL